MTPALPPLASLPSPQSCLVEASERGIKSLTSLTGQVILPRHNLKSLDRGLKPLKSLLPQIGITSRRFKKLEAIHLVREQRETGQQQLAFNARPFVLCGIPLRRPHSNQLVFTRRNGRFLLEITAHPCVGLPYGQDRLIPIWVATLAVQQKSRVVHFASAAQLLEFFRLPKDGPHYRRMMEGSSESLPRRSSSEQTNNQTQPPSSTWPDSNPSIVCTCGLTRGSSPYPPKTSTT